MAMCDSLFGIRQKSIGKLVAGFSSKNAYTSRGRARAAMREIYGKDNEDYEVVELIIKEDE